MLKLKVLCIPGWNESCCIFNKIEKELSDYFEFIYVELPGFSSNPLPPKAFYPKDYAIYINNLINEDIDLILAHSYGGKVAMEYYKMFKKVKMILLAPSIIKPKKNILTKIRIIKYKILKKLNLLKKNKEYGSEDYKNAKGIMKQVFINAINTYYDDEFSKIEDEVLLIYGKKDKQTPLKEGKRIKKKIKHASLLSIDGDHFALINNPRVIIKNIYKFGRKILWFLYYV